MPKTITFTSVDDLLEIVSGWSQHSRLARQYVTLLKRAATEGYPVGVQESTEWEAEALSDWDAAMAVNKDVRVEDVTAVREALNSTAEVVVADGSRKGKTKYQLNNKLIES
jgi:hypothetical protein